MELSKRYERSLENFQIALGTFKESLGKDFSEMDSIGLDLIKNGRIQKFEYTTELAWKTSKFFIEIRLGIISNSPKEVYRTMFREGMIEENTLQNLLQTIDDRNQISHIYREEMFDLIYEDLSKHLITLNELQEVFLIR